MNYSKMESQVRRFHSYRRITETGITNVVLTQHTRYQKGFENFDRFSSIHHPLHYVQDMQRLLLKAIVTLVFVSPCLRVRV